MRIFIRLFLLAAIMLSCKDDDIKPARSLTSYYIDYMPGADATIMPEANNKPIVRIEYGVDGNPSRRIGALINIPFLTGFTHKFTDLLYDDVTHSRDKITIIKKDDFPDLNVQQNRKELFMRDGKIIQAVILGWQDNMLDTIDFYYTGSTLSKTNQKTYRTSGERFTYMSTTEKHFTFSGGNLQKVEGIEYGWQAAAGPLYNTLEVFSDYDNAPNPAGRLIIFDETFYRALLKNNFRKYTFERRMIDGQLTSSRTQSWTFQYDEEGFPTFLY